MVSSAELNEPTVGLSPATITALFSAFSGYDGIAQLVEEL